MNHLAELKKIGTLVRKYALLFVATTAFFFFCGIGLISLWGISLPVPTLGNSSGSIAAETFTLLSQALIPQGVELVVIDPITPFAVQAQIAATLAFVVLLPLLIATFLRHLFPALYASERLYTLVLFLPACVLFTLGAAFALFFVIPSTFSVLYQFAPDIGASALFSADAFVRISLGLVVASGVAFMLPVLMAILALCGLISSSAFIHSWREACVGILAFCAIITPDGSGVSMLVLATPLALLYCLGIIASMAVSKWSFHYQS